MFSVISKAKFPSSSELVTRLGNSVTSGLSLVDNDKPISSSKSDIVVWSVMLPLPSAVTEIENSPSGFPKLSSEVEGVGRSVLIGMVTATSGSVSSEVVEVLKLGISISEEPTLSSTELSTSPKDPDTSIVVAIDVVLIMMSKLFILKTSSSCGGIGSIWSLGFWVLSEKGIVTISSFSEISKLVAFVVWLDCWSGSAVKSSSVKEVVRSGAPESPSVTDVSINESSTDGAVSSSLS